jgi:hypothetical protein
VIAPEEFTQPKEPRKSKHKGHGSHSHKGRNPVRGDGSPKR